MSTGGKYILETLLQSTPQENILLNMVQLQQSIEKRCVKKPFLLDLTTHCSYFKSYYKPSIPMAFEYNAILSENGDLQFGSESRFSLIQYGEYQAEMILEVTFGDLTTVSALDKCAYVDFPMHRLTEKVRIEFSGNKIDEYSYDANNIFYNFMVSEDKKNSWLDMVGQERPNQIYVQQSLADEYREVKNVVNGLQTLKRTHAGTTLYIPIIFQFSRQLSTALFSAKIPYGQRYLYVKLAKVDQLFYAIDNGGGGKFITPNVTGRLWVNQVFIEPTVKNILLPGNYRNFVRIYKEQRIGATTADNVLLDQLRYPVEHVFYGIRSAANNGPTTWWRFHLTPTIQTIFPVCVPPHQLAFNTTDCIVPQQNILYSGFLTKNTEITRMAPGNLYSKVFPYTKGKSAHDIGLQFFSFSDSLYTLNQKGYYNLNAQREFYLNYMANTGGELYVLAVCINWLNIGTNGSVTLLFP